MDRAGKHIIPGYEYPFGDLKEYLRQLIEIWKEAAELCKAEAAHLAAVMCTLHISIKRSKKR